MAYANLNTGRIVTVTMRPVILSTLPHFFALWFLYPFEGWDIQLYATIVTASSCASVAWHWSSEPGRQSRHGMALAEPCGQLFWIDYGLAAAWTAADLLLAAGGGPRLFATVAYLNLLTIMTNKVSDWMAEKGVVSYEVGHTVWHCVSWSKCWLVAWLLRGTG